MICPPINSVSTKVIIFKLNARNFSYHLPFVNQIELVGTNLYSTGKFAGLTENIKFAIKVVLK